MGYPRNQAYWDWLAAPLKHKEVEEQPKESVNEWQNLVTPTDFKHFIGQEHVKRELETMLEATAKHHIPIQHCLFSGSFGLGKTTIAKIFASQIGDYAILAADEKMLLSDLPKTKVVILDEIHILGTAEWLLSHMDNGNQTIFGTTTTAGTLSAPLRSRFVSLVLEPYSTADLEHIVRGVATNLKYDCPDFITHAVAQRGKAVARTAIILFKRIYDRVTITNGHITPLLLSNWFDEMQIDGDGLDNSDRAYLAALSSKPVGMQYLQSMTGMDRVTLEESVEPFLLTHGFVKRTPRGRVLGDKVVSTVWK
jgi:Holliday junction DNA helicase RuvB